MTEPDIPLDPTVTLIDEGEGYVSIPDWVMFHATLSPTAKIMYGVLKHYARQSGRSYPTQRRLGDDLAGRHTGRCCPDRTVPPAAKPTGVSKSTVKRLTDELEEAGAVQVRHRWQRRRPDGQYDYYLTPGLGRSPSSNLYILKWREPAASTGQVVPDNPDSGGAPIGAGTPMDEPTPMGAGTPMDAGTGTDGGRGTPMDAGRGTPMDDAQSTYTGKAHTQEAQTPPADAADDGALFDTPTAPDKINGSGDTRSSRRRGGGSGVVNSWRQVVLDWWDARHKAGLRVPAQGAPAVWQVVTTAAGAQGDEPRFREVLLAALTDLADRQWPISGTTLTVALREQREKLAGDDEHAPVNGNGRVNGNGHLGPYRDEQWMDGTASAEVAGW